MSIKHVHKILIINGPNLNLLGERQTKIYGDISFKQHLGELKKNYSNFVELDYHQTNHEGVIIDLLHNERRNVNGIVLNAGAYTHTSIAIADAIKCITTPVVEVHISNIYAREEFRKTSYLKDVCNHRIIGKGLKGYNLAIEWLIQLFQNNYIVKN